MIAHLRAVAAEFPHAPRSLIYTPGVLALATIVVALAARTSHGWSPDYPLPWDMSGHLEGALEMEEAYRSGSLSRVWSRWHAAGLYPPVHSAIFGAWFLLLGSSLVAWLALCALVYLATLTLLARLDLSGAAFFASLTLVSALAPTLMVEPLADLFLVAALLSAGRCARTPSSANVMAAGTLVAAVLLTKYNVGLPLLVALPLGSLIAWRRRSVLACGAAGLVALVVFVAFLSLQERGWEFFLRFAQNRSNAAELTMLARAEWYLDVIRSHFVGSPLALVVALALALWGIWKRSAVAVVATLYFSMSFLALIRHDYLLSRNLVAPAVALAVAVAAGARCLPRGRRGGLIRLGAVAVFAVGAWMGLPMRNQLTAQFQGPRDPDLETLTRILRAGMEGAGEVRVVGTFEQFSSGWVRIVGRQSPTQPVVRVDWDYPASLGLARDGRPSGWHPDYARTLSSWAEHGEPRVFAMRLEAASPYCGPGHRNWTQWKDNYVHAVPWTGWYSVWSEDRLSDGAVITVFDRLPARLEFGTGWADLEGWGRWTDAREATIFVPPLEAPMLLEYEWALSEHFEEGQSVDVVFDGEMVRKEELDPAPWLWKTGSLELPASASSRELTFVFRHLKTSAGGREFSMAFRRLVLRQVKPLSAR